MAKIYLPGADGVCCVIGLSTDEKPSTTTSNGFSFIEVDTGNIYLCDGQDWSAVASGSSWGGISGTLADQTDLQAALDAKAATSHNHDAAYSALGHNHDASYSAIGHNHAGVYEPANANIQAHVVSAHAPSNAQKNSDITKAEIEAKLTGVISSHSHAGGGGDPFLLKAILAADAATGANTTPISLTGFSFSYEANSQYFIDFCGAVRAAAATTGSGFQLDISSAVTRVGMTFSHQLANTGTLTGGSSIADDASVGVSSGRPSANTDTPVGGYGYLVTTGNTGTAQLRYRSEVAAVSTVMAGFMMRVMKMN